MIREDRSKIICSTFSEMVTKCGQLLGIGLYIGFLEGLTQKTMSASRAFVA